MVRSLKLFAGLLLVGSLSAISVQPAAAQYGSEDVQREVIGNVIQNIVATVRDEVRRHGVTPPPGMLRFSGETSDFDGRDIFAERRISDPFSALGYAKAPALVASTPAWLYGVNLVGSVDRASAAFSTRVDVQTVVGAFDVTKIGVFGSSDALTFIGTGGHSWSRASTPGFAMDSSAPSTSFTVSYLNGGFSIDGSVLLNWSQTSSNVGLAIPDGSGISYAFNTQYRFDFPYSVWFEPTIGVTYSESYGPNFGGKLGDMTELRGGTRIGTEMMWMGYKVQPTVSAIVFRIVDASFTGMADIYGVRGSAKMNVIWSKNFSSYLEAHGTGMSQQVAFLPAGGGASFQTIGAQAGLRYTW